MIEAHNQNSELAHALVEAALQECGATRNVHASVPSQKGNPFASDWAKRGADGHHILARRQVA